MEQESRIEHAFALARERYAEADVDVDAAIDRLSRVPISLHCWQGDDVTGFENTGQALGGGLAVTGSYPGRHVEGRRLQEIMDSRSFLILPQNRRFLPLPAGHSPFNAFLP